MLRKTTVVTTFGGFPFDGFDGLALAVIVNGEQDAAGLLPHINANHPRGGAAGTVVARLLGHAVNDAAALAPHRFVHLVPNANEAVAMYLGVTGFGLKQVVVANVGARNVQV